MPDLETRESITDAVTYLVYVENGRVKRINQSEKYVDDSSKSES